MIFGSKKKDVTGKPAPAAGEAAPKSKGESASPTNGGPQAKGAAGAGRKIRPRDLRQLRMAQSFSQVVAVLMRDPVYKNLRLSDLETMVLPPIMAGQFRVAHAATHQGKKQTSPFVPIAVALWARVSPAIDKKLSEQLDKPMQLPANAWASGDICWLITVAGDPRAVPKFLEQLQEKEFKGQQVKLRARDKDGKVVVRTLGKAA